MSGVGTKNQRELVRALSVAYGVRSRERDRERERWKRGEDNRQSNLIWKGGISGVKSSKARVSENYEIDTDPRLRGLAIDGL